MKLLNVVILRKATLSKLAEFFRILSNSSDEASKICFPKKRDNNYVGDKLMMIMNYPIDCYVERCIIQLQQPNLFKEAFLVFLDHIYTNS